MQIVLGFYVSMCDVQPFSADVFVMTIEREKLIYIDSADSEIAVSSVNKFLNANSYFFLLTRISFNLFLAVRGYLFYA